MSESKPHGNTGRRNAAKDEDEKLTSTLHIRVRPEEKAAWVRASRGGKLSDWVRSILNHASGHDPPDV